MARYRNGTNRPGPTCSVLNGPGNALPDTAFDKKQLQIGIKIEMEHTTDPEVAKAIAKDHLYEYEDYYTELLEMERRLEERKKRKR